MRLFSIALAALALVTCHTPLRLAEAQVLTEFPNEYRGTWCETSATIGAESATPQYYYRCRREADAMMQIEATWFGSDRYTECLPIHAIKTNHGDLMIQAVCRNHIAERPNLFDQRWRLEQGGRRLRVTTPDNGVPLPDQMLGLDPRGWQPQ
jgi:hypothetical protein